MLVLVFLTGCATQYKTVFDHEESRSNWCSCALLETQHGLFASVYNNSSRVNSELYLNWKKIYSGSQETIGQGLEHKNSVYFPVECGKGLIYRDGKVIETVKLDHSSLAIVYKDQPCFVSSEGSGEYIINAENGNKVLRLAVNAKVGIPMSAAKLPLSEEYIIVLADHGGNESLVTTDGTVIYLPNVTTVVNWDGKIIAGAAGIMYEINVDKKSYKKYYNTGTKMINHMWVDGGLLWVTCSSSDKLLYFTWTGSDYKVAEFTDDPWPTGKYFDSRIAKGWWARNKKTQAQWYKIEKK